MSLFNKTRGVLRKYRIRPRKRWGQNLLIDEKIRDSIIESADLKEDDIVLEIGPGIGTLTKRLAEKAGRVVAVEIDPCLVRILKEELKGEGIDIIQGDILKLNLSVLYSLCTTKIKVVANLPYYITSPVLAHLLKEKEKIESMVIMVQKEVGERILSTPGSKEYGPLTIFLNYHTEPEFILCVPKDSFFPPPQVEGMVLRLRVRKRPAVEVEDEDLFFKVVRTAFFRRRKTLLNSLSMGLEFEKKKIESLLLRADIDPKRRPETLSLQEFARLSHLFERNQLNLRIKKGG